MIRQARDLKAALVEAIRNQSGFVRQRDYLGMSRIGYCPRQLYRELTNPRPDLRDGEHWRSWLGVMLEGAIGELLQAEIERYPPGELVAGFDARYKGHVDFQTLDGQLLIEIKTVTWQAFTRLRIDNVFPDTHHAQVQAYLQHGPWQSAVLVYMARDIPNDRQEHCPFWTFDVYPDENIGRALDAKAKMVLAAWDSGEPPDCTCGRCRS